MKGSSLCIALYTYDVQKWPKLPMPANVYFNTYTGNFYQGIMLTIMRGTSPAGSDILGLKVPHMRVYYLHHRHVFSRNYTL